MPIYEYACKQCDNTLDALQKLSDPVLTDCPACGAVALKRLISAPRFRLKGDGWYETDFKKDNQRNLADGGKEKTGSDAGGSHDKSDGKSEAKPTADSNSKSAAKGADSTKPAAKTNDRPANKSTGKTTGNKPASKSTSSSQG